MGLRRPMSLTDLGLATCMPHSVPHSPRRVPVMWKQTGKPLGLAHDSTHNVIYNLPPQMPSSPLHCT